MTVSLRVKFIIITLTVIGLIQAGAGVLSFEELKHDLHQNLEDKANRTLSLLAKISATPLGEFDLPTLHSYAAEVVKDNQVIHVEYFDSVDAQVVGKDDKPTIDPLTTKKFEIKVKDEARDGEVVGKIIMYYSLVKMQEKLASTLKSLILQACAIFGLVATTLFLLFSVMINRRIKGLLNVILEVGKGVFTEEAQEKPHDELGRLGQGINKTSQNLQNLLKEIEARNAELQDLNHNLESIVEERTATIKMILNNVKSGFLVVDRKLTIQDGFTKSCHSIFNNKINEGQNLTDLFDISDRAKEHFTICLDQVFDDFLPEEVTLDQAPRRFEVGSETIDLQGSAIRNSDNEIVFILFTVNIVTHLVAMEKEKEITSSLIKILNQKEAFAHFLIDTKEMIEEGVKIVDDSNKIGRIKIILHTLKGNFSIFNFSEIAGLIHHIEERGNFTKKDFFEIEKVLKAFLETHYRVLKIAYEDQNKEVYEIDSNNVVNLVQSLKKSSDFDQLRSSVTQWLEQIKQKPASSVFGPIEDMIDTLAERLGKIVTFEFNGKDTMIDYDAIKDLVVVLPHVFRNCVDHGIESPVNRGKKPECGRIVLDVSQPKGGEFLNISISDDGIGIDGDGLARKAVKLGLISQKQADAMKDYEKVELLYNDGLSIRESANDISGRGVGMRAVKETVEQLGGRLRIHSTPGQGSTFAFTLELNTSTQALKQKKAS